MATPNKHPQQSTANYETLGDSRTSLERLLELAARHTQRQQDLGSMALSDVMHQATS